MLLRMYRYIFGHGTGLIPATCITRCPREKFQRPIIFLTGIIETAASRKQRWQHRLALPISYAS